MAKSRIRTTQRDFRNPTQSLSEMLLKPSLRPLSPLTLPDVTIQDDRLYNPSRPFQGATFFSGPTLVRTAKQAASKAHSVRHVLEMGFLTQPVQEFVDRRNPVLKAKICAKRKIKREVLFALKRTRKGSGAGRRRFNERSLVKC